MLPFKCLTQNGTTFGRVSLLDGLFSIWVRILKEIANLVANLSNSLKKITNLKILFQNYWSSQADALLACGHLRRGYHIIHMGRMAYILSTFMEWISHLSPRTWLKLNPPHWPVATHVTE